MEIRQIQYFLMLCNELHFSEAAYKLGISQPTLSQQIKVMEDELGVPLFDRIGKKTVKTEAGKLLEHHAAQIIQQLENAKTAIADLTNLDNGHLRIAVLPSDLDYRLTSLLIDFHHDFPNTKVQVIPSIDILNQVLDNEVDMGVGLAIQPDPRLSQIPFYTENYSLYVNKAHVFAMRDRVSPEDIAKIPLVLYPKGFYGRDLIDDWCRKHQITIHTIMETGSAASLFRLVTEGVGATIQPSQLLESLETQDILSIPIQFAPIRELEIYYRHDKYVSRAAKAFMTKLELFFKS
ncbi:LysR family transcriptional regulator [Paenibacillus selenitireducens]|uniref:LysR family transcriptional regulator n=1 Tax=Paenibacillus selenitireducens TaxID=1324314 RepID=A0A1T2X5L3_9BACL|nr:LysR substrate-binding domain-containing protein [Paenibacillus selenitireducens]OPA75140.1 LysR family transcriptional regulator [Paenibacillus selenitireducens]